MPTGKTLGELVIALRAEIGDSTNLSMGQESLVGLQQMLRRVQEQYYEDFDWPNHIIYRDEVAQVGERYYTFNADVDFQRIFGAWVRRGDEVSSPLWIPLEYGITPVDYNFSNSDISQTQPLPLRWNHYEDNQFEIWPVPSNEAVIRFRCMRQLPPLVAMTDTCVLDSNLLVLTAAAEILARSKAQDAQIKLTMATSHYNRLKGRLQKQRMFTLGASDHPHIRPKNWTIRVPR